MVGGGRGVYETGVTPGVDAVTPREVLAGHLADAGIDAQAAEGCGHELGNLIETSVDRVARRRVRHGPCEGDGLFVEHRRAASAQPHYGFEAPGAGRGRRLVESRGPGVLGTEDLVAGV